MHIIHDVTTNTEIGTWYSIRLNQIVILPQLLFLSEIQLHAELKEGTLVNPQRLNTNFSLVLFYNLLDYGQSKTYAFAVDFGCSLQLSKLGEKLLNFFW